jgi:hypothetical protein
MDYFKKQGVKTWGQLADYLGIHIYDLYGDEDIEPTDELWDCMLLDDLAVEDRLCTK